jgi:hypothetical protein
MVYGCSSSASRLLSCHPAVTQQTVTLRTLSPGVVGEGAAGMVRPGPPGKRACSSANPTRPPEGCVVFSCKSACWLRAGRLGRPAGAGNVPWVTRSLKSASLALSLRQVHTVGQGAGVSAVLRSAGNVRGLQPPWTMGLLGLSCCMRMCGKRALSFRVYAPVVSVKEVRTQRQPAQS